MRGLLKSPTLDEKGMGGLIIWSWAILPSWANFWCLVRSVHFSTRYHSRIHLHCYFPMFGAYIKLLTLQMSSLGRQVGCWSVPYRMKKGWVVSLYGLGQSSLLELVFKVELDPRSIFLCLYGKNWIERYILFCSLFF